VELEFGTMLVQEWIETGPQFEELGNAVEGGDAEEGGGIVLDEKSPPSIVGLYVEALHQGENLVQYPLSPTRGDLEEEEEVNFFKFENAIKNHKTNVRKNTTFKMCPFPYLGGPVKTGNFDVLRVKF
jgi:hypothetical protein